MRILIVSPCYHSHSSGIEMCVHFLAKSFADAGHEVTVASRIDVSRIAEKPPGYAHVTIDARDVTESTAGFPYPILLPRAISKLGALVGKADIVNAHDGLYLSTTAAVFAAARRKVPVVLTQHIGMVPYESRVLRGLMSVANHTLAKSNLNAAREIIVYSRAVHDYLTENLRVKHTPRFVANGVDRDIFRPHDPSACRKTLRTGLGLPAEAPIVLFVGRFVEKKGIEHMEEVCERLPHVTFCFVGAGPHDPRQWALPNAVVRNALKPEELCFYYNAADLLVLPSRGEGFPLVVQEGMACGLPSIITSETARALPFTYDTALEIPEPSADAIVARVRALLEDGTERDRLARYSLEIADRHWSWTRTAAAYVEVFEIARGERRPHGA